MVTIWPNFFMNELESLGAVVDWMSCLRLGVQEVVKTTSGFKGSCLDWCAGKAAREPWKP